MTTLFSKIKEVTELSAISGHEAPVRAYLREKITPHVDEVVTDGLGGIFGVKHSEVENAPRVLVASHMDEVGFMVSEIKPDGTFRVVSIGGWNPMVVSSQRFKLFTREGREIPVISGSVPPHLTRGTGGPTMPAISDIVFDGGFADKAEAESFGIRPGDTIVPDSSAILTANEKNIISKAWDNRYGVLMVSELAENLSGQKLGNELYLGANVQEEVGLRGAHLLLPGMKDFLLTTAEEAGIKYQYYCGKGGTDAGAAHLKNGGVPSTTIGVCARYIHSHQTLYAMDDFLEAQAFLQALVKKLDRSTVDLIKNY